MFGEEKLVYQYIAVDGKFRIIGTFCCSMWNRKICYWTCFNLLERKGNTVNGFPLSIKNWYFRRNSYLQFHTWELVFKCGII